MAAWRAEDDVVTDRRVIKVQGVLNRVVAESALRRVDDAVLRQGVVGRLLGYGDLVLVTGPDASVDASGCSTTRRRSSRAMLEAKYASERDITPPTPGPALRVPVGAGVVPAPGDEPLSRSPRPWPACRHARPRAISPADYDAKKADLLRRMWSSTPPAAGTVRYAGSLVARGPGVLNFRPENIVLAAIFLLVALPFHEFSHAFVAWRLGDATAKLFGRLTFNSIVHFDPIGGSILWR